MKPKRKLPYKKKAKKPRKARSSTRIENETDTELKFIYVNRGKETANDQSCSIAFNYVVHGERQHIMAGGVPLSPKNVRSLRDWLDKVFNIENGEAR